MSSFLVARASVVLKSLLSPRRHPAPSAATSPGQEVPAATSSPPAPTSSTSPAEDRALAAALALADAVPVAFDDGSDDESGSSECDGMHAEHDTHVATPLDLLVKPMPPAPQPMHPPGALFPPQAPEHSGRLCVVLDVDETLLHAIVEPMLGGADIEPDGHDYACTFNYAGDAYRALVYLRPHVLRFLEEAAKFCELTVFTAGSASYAIPVLNALDPQGHIKHRLYRDAIVSCPTTGSYAKDLELTGRDLSRTVLIDNSPRVFSYQPGNGVVIRDYLADDDGCTALLELLPILHAMAHSGRDVREHVRELPVFNGRTNFGRLPNNAF